MYYVWRVAPPPFMHAGSEYEYKFLEIQMYVGILLSKTEYIKADYDILVRKLLQKQLIDVKSSRYMLTYVL